MEGFTHLLPLERPIWARYLEATGEEFQSLTYDLHLGEGAAIDPTWPEWLVRQVRAVSRKRVDVIGETSGAVILFEVKPRCGMSALGQLLCYRELYVAEHRPRKRVRLVCVCGRVEPDVSGVFASFGVEIAVV
jgi:hypothetical protein